LNQALSSDASWVFFLMTDLLALLGTLIEITDHHGLKLALLLADKI
jgi:hypothetical protein